MSITMTAVWAGSRRFSTVSRSCRVIIVSVVVLVGSAEHAGVVDRASAEQGRRDVRLGNVGFQHGHDVGGEHHETGELARLARADAMLPERGTRGVIGVEPQRLVAGQLL